MPLTRHRVIQEAVALADTSGVTALTMRALANRLGVEAMSLYHHVKNKTEILDAMVDAVFAEITLPHPQTDWLPAMRDRATSMRTTLLHHPWAITLMDSRKTPGEATLTHHNAVIGCLRQAGFTIAGAAHAFSLLDSYTYGFTQQELSLPFTEPTETTAVATDILNQLPQDKYPHLTEMIINHALNPTYNYTKEFHIGLDLILDGLERHKNTW